MQILMKSQHRQPICILDRKHSELHKFEYKVIWSGLPLNQFTWENEKSLKLWPNLIKEFNKNHPLSRGSLTNELAS